MLNLITKTDFVGFRNIDFKESTDNFDVYSEQLEQKILTDLFGVDMYNDMLANPTSPEYVTLIEDYLQSMQVGFFYYYFNIDRASYSTTVGEFEAAAENAVKNPLSRNRKNTEAYNSGVKYYVACADYVGQNTDDYPLYTETKTKKLLNVYGITAVDGAMGSIPCDHDDWFIRGKR